MYVLAKETRLINRTCKRPVLKIVGMLSHAV